MKSIFFCILILVLNTSFLSQVTLEWVNSDARYGTQSVSAVKVLVDSTNTPLVLHLLMGWEATPQMQLYKLNQSNGNHIWVAPSTPACNGQFIFLDSLNNIYVSGMEKNGFSGQYPFLAKYLPSGSRTFYVRDNILPFPQIVSATLDKEGNSYLLSLYNNRFRIVKYNNNGVINWNATYGDHNSLNNPNYITLGNQNDLLISGTTQRNNILYICILKASKNNLSFLDTIDYALPANTIGANVYKIQVDSGNNLYVLGISRELQVRKYQFIKLGPNNEVLWVKSDPANELKPNFLLLSDGSIIRTHISGISKYTQNGIELWTIINKYIYDMTESKDNKIFITGFTPLSGPCSYYTSKIDYGGNLIWEITYNNPNYNYNTAVSIALDSNENVFVHGQGSQQPASIVSTLKYSQLTGIIQSTNELPLKTQLFQNYPNPFNPETEISFSIDKAMHVKLYIFDITGKEILEFVHSNLEPGFYNYRWNGQEYSSGIYFIKLLTEHYSKTIKMALIK